METIFQKKNSAFSAKTLIIWLIIAAFGIIFVLIGTSKANNRPHNSIGIIVPLTGVVASYGEEMKKGIGAHAGREINDQGHIIQLLYEDDECDAKKAVSAFKKLVELDKVKIIIGPACGSPQEALVPLVKDRDVIVLLPSAASRNLFADSGGKIFNVQSSLEDEAAYLAEQVSGVEGQNPTRIALVTYKNAFSQAIADSFKANFKGEIVDELIFVEGTDDVSSQLASLRKVKLDAIVVTDISFFFAQGISKMKQFGISAPVYSTYVVELPAVRALVPGVHYSFPQNIANDHGKGAIYVLAGEAYELAKQIVEKCKTDFQCISNTISIDERFDQNGISNRGFEMRQIPD